MVKRPASVLTEDEYAPGIPRWRIVYPRLKADGQFKKSEKQLEKYAALFVSPFQPKHELQDALNIVHVVQPAKTWFDLKKYSKFIIQGEEFKNSEFVWVKPDDIDPDGPMEETDFWVARILEVRAIDAAHVFAKIVWMYRPAQLEECIDTVSGKAVSGARPYHGRFEVIASNHIDIVDVTCFAGKAPVEHWLEEDIEDVQEGLYWRQTFNLQTRKLSDTRRHCICKQPYNPDKRMFMCTNSKCAIWLHEECIIADILQHAYSTKATIKTPVAVVGAPDDSITITEKSAQPQNETVDESQPAVKAKAKSKSPVRGPDGSKKDYDGIFSAIVVQNNDDAPFVEITDLRKEVQGKAKTWQEDIKCLKCRSTLQ